MEVLIYMKNRKSLFFGDVDWNRDSHQVCVVDQEGSVIGKKNVEHTKTIIKRMKVVCYRGREN